jgi:probable addiction module antidote protein
MAETEVSKEAEVERHPSIREIVGYLNDAFQSDDVDRICQAIGAAARSHNTADIARKAGLNRPSVYRAFAGGGTFPNLTTVVGVLGAMGLRLKVVPKSGHKAKPSRLARAPTGKL